jgi:hypothetical protein
MLAGILASLAQYDLLDVLLPGDRGVLATGQSWCV